MIREFIEFLRLYLHFITHSECDVFQCTRLVPDDVEESILYVDMAVEVCGDEKNAD